MEKIYLNLKDKEFRRMYKEDPEAILLDVRMKEEYDEDRICDSILCDFLQTTDFENYVSALDKNRYYYVYCMTGHRSVCACEMMQKMGFNYLVNLTGGMIRFSGKICSD
jgi:rhodanese-related sulfurtransferase